MISTFIEFMDSRGLLSDYCMAYHLPVNNEHRCCRFSDVCDIINTTLLWDQSNTENVSWDDVHDEWYDFVDGNDDSIKLSDLEEALELYTNLMFQYLNLKDK